MFLQVKLTQQTNGLPFPFREMQTNKIVMAYTLQANKNL